jgi:outer membrane immunogenic protein
MKKSMYTAAVLAVLAAPSFAGGPITVVEEPVPVAPPAPVAAYDWTGPYVGLSYGNTSGSTQTIGPDAFADLEDGSAVTGYAGYLFQNNGWVYGGELAYSNLSDTLVTGFPEEVTDALDLKGRVGYAADRFLMYGVLGWSEVSYDRTLIGDSTDFSGMNYGIGAEYAITDMFGMGLEYLVRDVDGDSLNGGGQTQEFDLDTVSLRLGLSF